MDHDPDLTALRASAQAECRRCQGRRYGDCSDQCAFWALTASPGELEEVRRVGATWKPWNTMRPVEWAGGRHEGAEIIDHGEAA